MLYPDYVIKKGSLLTEHYIKKHYNEFYEYLMDNSPSDISFNEKIYWFYNNINDYPKCKYCGSRVNFKNQSKGYYDFCSLKCSNNSPHTKNKKRSTIIDNCGSVEESYNIRKIKSKQTLIDKYGSLEESYKVRYEKTKQTNLEKYGVETLMGTEEFQEKTKQTLIDKYGSLEESYKVRYEKTKQTNLEKYGVETLMGTEEFQEKTKQTNLKRYGCENPMQNNNIKSKQKDNNIKKYGVSCTLMLKDVKEKTKQTNLKRYGVEYPLQNNDVKKKSLDTKISNIIKSKNDLLDIIYNDELYMYKCKCPHEECNKCLNRYYLCSPITYYNRRYKKSELCTNLLPEQKDHTKNTTLEIFVKNILDKYHIDYECNNRTILNGKELDIYIPSKKLAIECNGIYWHSLQNNKSQKYHYDKYISCKNKGIQLITIWEDQIYNYPDKIESIILNKCNFSHKIYARKCMIKEISRSECKHFLDENHLQGNIYSSIKLGLYYKDELVSVMTFGKERKSLNNKSTEGSYELYRFCNKLNTVVVGGASKLMKYFITKYSPNTIISFSANDISNGVLYDKLGFVKISENLSYWYIDNNFKRYHRYNFNKQNLKNMGFGVEETENNATKQLGLFKIYDSGQTKYILKLNNLNK